jgi:site-specific recombinase XerD
MSVKGEKYPAEPLASHEVQMLLTQCSPRCPTGRRNRALIVVMWRGGLRVSEALDLEPRDLRDGVVRIRNGKGRKARTVALDAQAWAVVDRWLQDRRDLPGKKVFCTLKGDDLDSRYVRALLPRLAKKAGIEKRVHAHGLRHSFAFDLAGEGMDLREIQQALGHASLQATTVYVSHLNPKSLLDQLRQRTW